MYGIVLLLFGKLLNQTTLYFRIKNPHQNMTLFLSQMVFFSIFFMF